MIIEDEAQVDEELEDWVEVEKAEDEARRQARENNRRGREEGGARVAVENDAEREQQQQDQEQDLAYARSMDLQTFISKRYEIKNASENAVLKEALKEHLWALKGKGI